MFAKVGLFNCSMPSIFLRFCLYPLLDVWVWPVDLFHANSSIYLAIIVFINKGWHQPNRARHCFRRYHWLIALMANTWNDEWIWTNLDVAIRLGGCPPLSIQRWSNWGVRLCSICHACTDLAWPAEHLKRCDGFYALLQFGISMMGPCLPICICMQLSPRHF